MATNGCAQRRKLFMSIDSPALDACLCTLIRANIVVKTVVRKLRCLGRGIDSNPRATIWKIVSQLKTKNNSVYGVASRLLRTKEFRASFRNARLNGVNG